ncbi:MAG: class I SAM-dependent methyltransferase [Anaerolineae bacterium]
METIPCPLCGSRDAVVVARHRDRMLGIEGEFTMTRCAGCGLLYLNPQPGPEELARYYPESYEPYLAGTEGASSRLKRLSLEYGLAKRCRVVTRYKESGRLLEIGCANGLFLDAMRRRGDWDVQGVDISPHAVSSARERLGLDVFLGSLHEAQFAGGSFDVVVMWDVLEHVHDPAATLAEIRRILAPDGLLIFRLPQLDAWERRWFGPYWSGWDAPRHLTLFSRRTLGLMLARSRFRIEKMACISGGYLTFVLSVRFWAREHLSARGQRWLRVVLESLPLRLLTAPLFYVIDRLQKSTVVTVVARPNNLRDVGQMGQFAPHP